MIKDNYNKAFEGVVNALSTDGQEFPLESGRVIHIRPSKSFARTLLNGGWFSDWVTDEERYYDFLDNDK